MKSFLKFLVIIFVVEYLGCAFAYQTLTFNELTDGSRLAMFLFWILISVMVYMTNEDLNGNNLK